MPEPAVWVLMFMGFGLTGIALRRRLMGAGAFGGRADAIDPGSWRLGKAWRGLVHSVSDPTLTWPSAQTAFNSRVA
ncbi:PEPxxWA-CTERM sorting domain-containing protein [Phenylobacterium sp.]|uniref:PEPxxWA-CTERM sorting domain-containing protein n=1 Tax=Phenylobacterium sp. TaxID=1871053 RepID=UPI003459576F